ncbi:MAG TPA: RNA polymerase sporulation sigma factor SigK [Clostridia bacterium]|nr:RNA polymerase sporulation sigma factor SigK [Clostridia bacterium]
MGLEVLTWLLDLIRGWRWLVGSIENASSFPQPLSEEDEAKYLRLLRQGDRTAGNILVERNLRLVAHVVKKFGNTDTDVDDLISIGTLGLMKAINTYDPEKGTKLATYAAKCIENEILMSLRQAKRARKEVYLYEPIGTDKEGNEITLMDVLRSDPDDVSDCVGCRFDKARLEEVIKTLDKKERQVIEMRYGLRGQKRRTQREIARLLGISRSYVSRIEKKAVGRLAREFELAETEAKTRAGCAM